MEIRHKLEGEAEILSLSDIGHSGELPETHDTLEGNSLEKAMYIYEKYGINCFADDTGLLVEALDGEPGVRSARYAGPACRSGDNIDLLLENLGNNANRKAKFITVITLILDGKLHTFTGEVNGIITKERRGTGGFGYDPVFLPDGWDKTFAELDLKEKNAISHRAIAVQKLVSFLKGQ